MSGRVVSARWWRSGLFGEAQRHGQFRVDLVDLAETPLPLVLLPEPPAIARTDTRPAEMAGLAKRLAAAEAFVVVTP
jgi:NAD(P)H-dependent FMN reductase